MGVAAPPASAAGSSVSRDRRARDVQFEAGTAVMSAACSSVSRRAWSGILVALACPGERRAGGLGHWNKRAHQELPRVGGAAHTGSGASLRPMPAAPGEGAVALGPGAYAAAPPFSLAAPVGLPRHQSLFSEVAAADTCAGRAPWKSCDRRLGVGASLGASAHWRAPYAGSRHHHTRPDLTGRCIATPTAALRVSAQARH